MLAIPYKIIKIIFFIQIENCEVQENIVESEDGNEGWVETHHFDSALSPLSEKISEISLEVCKTKSKSNLLFK